MTDATAKREQAAVEKVRAFAAEWAQHYGGEIEQAFRTVLQILDRRKDLLEMAIDVDRQRDRSDTRCKLLDRRHRAAAVILDGRADDLLEEIARRAT